MYQLYRWSDGHVTLPCISCIVGLLCSCYIRYLLAPGLVFCPTTTMMFNNALKLITAATQMPTVSGNSIFFIKFVLFCHWCISMQTPWENYWHGACSFCWINIVDGYSQLADITFYSIVTYSIGRWTAWAWVSSFLMVHRLIQANLGN